MSGPKTTPRWDMMLKASRATGQLPDGMIRRGVGLPNRNVKLHAYDELAIERFGNDVGFRHFPQLRDRAAAQFDSKTLERDTQLRALLDRGALTEAAAGYRECLRVAHVDGTPLARGLWQQRLGEVESRMGNRRIAGNFYAHAALDFVQVGNDKDEAIALKETSQVAFELGQFPLAQDCLEELWGLSLMRAEAYPWMQLAAHDGLGQLALVKGDWAGAKQHFQYLGYLAGVQQNQKAQFTATLGLAKVFLAQGKKDLAEKQFEKAKALNSPSLGPQAAMELCVFPFLREALAGEINYAKTLFPALLRSAKLGSSSVNAALAVGFLRHALRPVGQNADLAIFTAQLSAFYLDAGSHELAALYALEAAHIALACKKEHLAKTQATRALDYAEQVQDQKLIAAAQAFLAELPR